MTDFTCGAHNITFPKGQSCPLCKTEELKQEQARSKQADIDGYRRGDDAPVDEIYGCWCELCCEFWAHVSIEDHTLEHHMDGWDDFQYECSWCGGVYSDIGDARWCCHEEGIIWECTYCGTGHLNSEDATDCCYNAKTEAA